MEENVITRTLMILMTPMTRMIPTTPTIHLIPPAVVTVAEDDQTDAIDAKECDLRTRKGLLLFQFLACKVYYYHELSLVDFVDRY